MASPARRRATTLATAAVCAVLAAQGSITDTINRSADPTSDEQDADSRIAAAMDAAVARHNSLSHLSENLVVHDHPGTPTADGNDNSTVNAAPTPTP